MNPIQRALQKSEKNHLHHHSDLFGRVRANRTGRSGMPALTTMLLVCAMSCGCGGDNPAQAPGSDSDAPGANAAVGDLPGG